MRIQKLFDYDVPTVAGATVLSLGALLVAIVIGYTALSIKTSADRIEVTGSAKEAVTADRARWVINLDTRTRLDDQETGYARLEGATQKISRYLTEKGFSDFEMPTGSSYQTYVYPQYGEPTPTGYTVSRQIIVRSDDIDGISKLANEIEPLTGEGYNVSSQSLELTYSKLDEMRVKLLSEAIKDAKARAESIAKESGRTVGALRNASSGVVQVLPEGAVEVSDYGAYDTQSRKKEVMVTVRASFEL